MIRQLLTTLALCLAVHSALAADIGNTYNLSKMSSYIAVTAITPNTYCALRDSMLLLHERYGSVDFVLDFLHTIGDYGMDAVILADSLLRHSYRIGILIGEGTLGAAEQTAMFLHNAKRAVLVGTKTPGGLRPDIVLEANNAYQTAYYDSLQCYDIPRRTAQRFAATHALNEQYACADELLADVHHDGALITMLNDVAREYGVEENKEAFMYSGFTIVAQMKAALIREVFPNDLQAYYKALNRPIQQAIFDAMNTIQTAAFREILEL